MSVKSTYKNLIGRRCKLHQHHNETGVEDILLDVEDIEDINLKLRNNIALGADRLPAELFKVGRQEPTG